MALLPDKRHGEGGVAVHRGKILQESGVGDIVVIQQTKPLFLMGFQRASHLKNWFCEISYLSQSCSMVKSPAKYSPRRRGRRTGCRLGKE